MTAEEAINEVEKFILQIEHSIAEECSEYVGAEYAKETDRRLIDGMNMAIEALKEVQQYREIGTIEDIKTVINLLSLPESSIVDDFHELTEYRKLGTVEECRISRRNRTA